MLCHLNCISFQCNCENSVLFALGEKYKTYEQNRTSYITCVMLYNICHVMLYNICHVMLYNICYAMLYKICYVMLYNIKYVTL